MNLRKWHRNKIRINSLENPFCIFACIALNWILPFSPKHLCSSIWCAYHHLSRGFPKGWGTQIKINCLGCTCSVVLSIQNSIRTRNFNWKGHHYIEIQICTHGDLNICYEEYHGNTCLLCITYTTEFLFYFYTNGSPYVVPDSCLCYNECACLKVSDLTVHTYSCIRRGFDETTCTWTTATQLWKGSHNTFGSKVHSERTNFGNRQNPSARKACILPTE